MTRKLILLGIVAAFAVAGSVVIASAHGDEPAAPSPEDVRGAQADTTKADAVMEALLAEEIKEEQNPCTYPAELREIIELSDEQCDGALGQTLAKQYPSARSPNRSDVTCETRSQVIGRAPAANRQDIAAGPVAFYRAKEVARWDREFLEPKGSSELAPVKLPIIVASGSPVTLSLTDRSRRHAVLNIGRDRGRDLRGPEVTLVPCPPDAEVAGRPVGRRTIFTGGFRVDGPRCLEVAVSSPSLSSPRTREIALGRRDCGWALLVRSATLRRAAGQETVEALNTTVRLNLVPSIWTP